MLWGRGLRGEDGLSLDLHDVLDLNQEDTKPDWGTLWLEAGFIWCLEGKGLGSSMSYIWVRGPLKQSPAAPCFSVSLFHSLIFCNTSLPFPSRVCLHYFFLVESYPHSSWSAVALIFDVLVSPSSSSVGIISCHYWFVAIFHSWRWNGLTSY